MAGLISVFAARGHARPSTETTGAPAVPTTVGEKFRTLTDYFLPRQCAENSELTRRARLIIRFGLLGFCFGIAYASFYWLIGHYWGTGIIVLCSWGVAIAPWLMRKSGSLSLAANTLSLVLTLGFTALCAVEGGLHGHAIAWLVSVPLCALILLGKNPAKWWVAISFFAASLVACMDLAGVKIAPMYDPVWEPVISSAGYLGLIIFLFMLGMIFETGRERAFAKMQDALTKLETSNERLMYLNNEKNEFLGIAAHDLKSPLTVIIGNAELLASSQNTSQIERFARTIVSAGTRMRDLVNNLLDANAIEEGKFTSNVERCDVAALVQQSVDNNQAAAARKGTILQADARAGLWGMADRDATLQVLDNLISNAVKYAPPKTTVQITAFADNACVAFAVIDQGPGISETDQKKLFGKFTRLSARPTGGESSTGLGLSIAKRLAEAMSGTVRCQSVPGAGATFTLRLPVWTETRNENDCIRTTAATPRRSSELSDRILVPRAEE